MPGNNNPAFLAELFLEQSRLWPGLAEHHICNVLGIVSGWMPVALRKTISEDSVRGHVHAILTEWRDTTEKLALGELERLVEDERRDPLTYNHYYTDNVQKARLNSQKEAIRNAVSHAIAVDHRGKLLIGNTREDLEGLISSMESRITLDMDEQACNEAATQLDAYYNVFGEFCLHLLHHHETDWIAGRPEDFYRQRDAASCRAPDNGSFPGRLFSKGNLAAVG